MVIRCFKKKLEEFTPPGWLILVCLIQAPNIQRTRLNLNNTESQAFFILKISYLSKIISNELYHYCHTNTYLLYYLTFI